MRIYLYVCIYIYRNSRKLHMTIETELYLKRLLETLLLAMKRCTGFTIDVIWVNKNVCSITSEPTQSSSRHISSFKDLSALLNN